MRRELVTQAYSRRENHVILAWFLFLVLLLLALGIFVKVLDALRQQRQFDGLLRQGRNVKEQELSRMGALALRKELNIRRLQLIGLSAFADQRGE